MSWNELPYTADEVPVRKIFDIGGTQLNYELQYNAIGDFYTLKILDLEDNIIYTTKMVSANDALHAAKNLLDYDDEDIEIYPASFTNINIRLGISTLGGEVKVYEFVPAV